MRKFLKRLFCKHLWIWHRNIYGDEINLTNKRSVSKCYICEKYKAFDYLNENKVI